MTAIADPQTFAETHSISWKDFASDLSFEDKGELVIPLAGTLELVRRLALSDPPRMLNYLEAKLEDATGRHLDAVAHEDADRRRMTLNGSSTRPYIEDFAEAVDVIKGWIGMPQVNAWNEVTELRAEVARLSSIISKASGILHDHGLTRDASSIRRLHGLTDYPVPRLRSYYEMTCDMKKSMS